MCLLLPLFHKGLRSAIAVRGDFSWGISALKLAFVFFLGASYGMFHVNLHLAKVYPLAEQKQFITIIGAVVDLPQYDKDKNQEKVKFHFLIEKVLQPANSQIKPGLIRLTWQTTKVVQIGDKWQLTVRLKRPRGFATPGCFDVEKYYFSKHIIATGYVVDKFPKNKKNLYTYYPHKKLYNKSFLSLLYNSGHKLRQYFNDNIIQTLKGKEFAGVILALVTGVQNKIAAGQWSILKDTGTEHLVAIAGLHIGFIAGLAFVFAGILWRLMPNRWFKKIPAPVVGAIGAIITAFFYAYLAGFSVSTKRACIMVIMAMLGIIFRRVVLPADIFAYALLIVLVMDPFATFTLSFWLSFTAVAIMLYAFVGRKTINKFNRWIKPNLVMAIGMMPLLLMYFNAVPLISPIANLIAIPWVSFSVMPLALLGSIIYPVWTGGGEWLWNFANLSLQWLWPILTKLQQLPWANWQPVIPSMWYLGLTFIGVLWLLAPRGCPGRIFGLCGFLPLLFPTIPHTMPGQVNFTLLDVGQGLAVVIETSNHVLVYDTGPKFSDNFDAGEQVVWPFLRSSNIKHIDKLVISHADLDHSGGMQSLLNHMVQQQILPPKPELLAQYLSLLENDKVLPCIAGQHWQWDDVNFAMLHPTATISRQKNEQSCVLHIKTATSSILLTGDIGYISEKNLVARYKDTLSADIIVVPHHGSKRSSSIALVQAVKAKYAIASVGYLNQYGHPNPFVVTSYHRNGAKFMDTAQAGAISFELIGKNKQLKANCYRINHRKIWNIEVYE